MITARPLQLRTAPEQQALIAETVEASLLFRYRELENEELFAITRHDFAPANRALSLRLKIKTLLLDNQMHP